MFLGTIDHFIVYNEGEFACPKCHYIHFQDVWWPFYKADFEKFEIRCKNSKCYIYLVAMRVDNYMLVTEKKIETFLQKTNKINMKSINVQAHLKRYEGVDINDKLALIEALKKMIEQDRVDMVESMKAKLAQLEKGEIPAPDPVDENKSKRTRKKKDAQTEQDLGRIQTLIEGGQLTDEEIQSDDL